MTFKMKYKTRNDLMPKGTKRRSGTKNLGVKFITLHDTGNPNSTAQGNVNYYKNSANSQSASAHVFIDEKEILICAPLNEKCWHVLYNITTDNMIYGDDANDIAIGVELCYFPKDKARTLEAYKKYVWFNAWLAYEYKLNPHTSFIGHNMLDPKRKVDPMNALNVLGKTYKQLLQDIVDEYIECITVDKPVTIAKLPLTKEELELENPLYKPSNATLINDTITVLRRLEAKENEPLSEAWRLKAANGELTESDAIALLYTAIKRGHIQGEQKPEAEAK